MNNISKKTRELMSQNFTACTGYWAVFNEYLKASGINTTELSVDTLAKMNKPTMDYSDIPFFTTIEKKFRAIRNNPTKEQKKCGINLEGLTPPREYDTLSGSDIRYHEALMVNVPSPLFNTPFVTGVYFSDLTEQQQIALIKMLTN